MTVTATWTDPTTLNKAVGAIVPSTDYNALQSDVDYLGGSDGNTHSGASNTSTTPLTVTTEHEVFHSAASPTVHLPSTPTLGHEIVVKHMGTGTMTLNVNGGAAIIWVVSPVASPSLGVGDAYTFHGTGTYWAVVG